MFCILGLPGVGKGIQSVKLQEEMGIYHIAVGVLLRKIAKNDQKISELLKSGHLVDDNLVSQLIINEINNAKRENKIFVIDGYPRTYKQAVSLLKMLKESGAPQIQKVILLECSENVVIDRLLKRKICPNCPRSFSKENDICNICNVVLNIREDDNIEAIKNRINIAKTELTNILSCFPQQIVTVDSNLPINYVSQKIQNIVKETIIDYKCEK